MSLPETAIGTDLPPILMELTASRISPLHLTRHAVRRLAFIGGRLEDTVFQRPLTCGLITPSNPQLEKQTP